MARLIIITGTPATGKSTLALELENRARFTRLDLHDLMNFYPAIVLGYNRSKRCYDIDIEALSFILQQILDENDFETFILDTHIGHLLPPEFVDLVVVMHCSNLKILKKRLVKRKYHSKKVRENIDAEIFAECLDGAYQMGVPVLIFDTASTMSVEKMVEKIILNVEQ